MSSISFKVSKQLHARKLLRYVTLHYVTLCYVTLRYVTLRHVMLLSHEPWAVIDCLRMFHCNWIGLDWIGQLDRQLFAILRRFCYWISEQKSLTGIQSYFRFWKKWAWAPLKAILSHELMVSAVSAIDYLRTVSCKQIIRPTLFLNRAGHGPTERHKNERQ